MSCMTEHITAEQVFWHTEFAGQHNGLSRPIELGEYIQGPIHGGAGPISFAKHFNQNVQIVKNKSLLLYNHRSWQVCLISHTQETN